MTVTAMIDPEDTLADELSGFDKAVQDKLDEFAEEPDNVAEAMCMIDNEPYEAFIKALATQTPDEAYKVFREFFNEMYRTSAITEVFADRDKMLRERGRPRVRFTDMARHG